MPSELRPVAAETVAAVLAHAAGRPPTLGEGRLVCVDGPAGSGKTTLARALAEETGARVVHMDDLYAGWSGLATVDEALAGLLRPLADGQPGFYRRFDWELDAYAELHVVAPTPLLVVEGVGSGSAVTADLVTTLVFVDAPHDLRMARGLARDGDALAPHWASWAEHEAARFAADRTRERADLLVDAHGRLVP